MKKIALSALVIAASGAYVWSQAGATDPLLSGTSEQTGSIGRQALTSASSAALTPREVPFVTHEAALPARPASPPPAAQTIATPLPPLPAPEDAPAAVAESPMTPADPAPPSAPASRVAEAQPSVAPEPAAAEPAVNVPLPRPRPPYRQVAAVAPTPAPASASSSALDRNASSAALMRIAAATSMLRDGTYAGPVVDAYYGLMQIEAVIQNGRLTTVHVLQYPNDRRTSVFINRQALPLLRDEVIQAQSAKVDIVSGATLTSRAFIQSLGAALHQAGA